MKHTLSLALVAAVVFALYAHTLSYPYIYDDSINFTDNPGIRSLDLMFSGEREIARAGARPVMHHHFRVRVIPYLSYWANYRLGGYEPAAYWRFVNVALHAVMGCLVYAFTALLFQTPRLRGVWDERRVWAVALLSALIYAVHPLATESVVYVSGRVGQIAAAFYLGAVVGYLAWRVTGNRAYYAFSLLSGLGGMFSKETVFTMPLMVVLVEWIFGEGAGWRRWRAVAPHLLLLPVIPVAKVLTLMGDGGVMAAVEEGSRLLTSIPREQYLYTQFTVLVRYLRLIFYPAGQCADYLWPLMRSLWEPRVLGSLALLLAVMALGVWALRAGRAERPELRVLGFGVFGFFLALSIESSVFPIVIFIAEYRTYLPMAFFVPGVVVAAGSIRRGGAALALIVVSALAAATVSRSGVWKDDMSFWSDVLKSNPNNPRAYYSIGNVYDELDDRKSAIEYYEKAVALQPDKVKYLINLGSEYQKASMNAEARKAYEAALKVEPGNPPALFNIGILHEIEGRPDLAVPYYESVFNSPDNFEVRWSRFYAGKALVTALIKAGRCGEAAGSFESVSMAAGRGDAAALVKLRERLEGCASGQLDKMKSRR